MGVTFSPVMGLHLHIPRGCDSQEVTDIRTLGKTTECGLTPPPTVVTRTQRFFPWGPS